MIKAIAHICIVAQDLTETERFYCDCLGLKKKFDFIRDGEVCGYYLAVNDYNFIEVFAAAAPTTGETPVKHFCLEVDDLDETVTALRRAGVRVTDKKLGADRSYQAWLADPNGIDIELHEYTGKSCQHTGADCVI